MATHMDLKATWSIPFLFTCGRLVPFFRGTHTHALNIPEIPGCSALAANCRQDTIPFFLFTEMDKHSPDATGKPKFKIFLGPAFYDRGISKENGQLFPFRSDTDSVLLAVSIRPFKGF